MADLRTSIGKLELANPVMTASGTFGYGTEFADFVDLDRLGGVIVKGILFLKGLKGSMRGDSNVCNANFASSLRDVPFKRSSLKLFLYTN